MKKVRPYDDNELVCDLAEGKLTLREIARKHGLSATQMYNVAEGRRRPDIRRQVIRLWKMSLDDLRRVSVASVKRIMDLQIDVALSDRGHNGRMAREYVLDRLVRDQDLRLPDAEADETDCRTPTGRWRRLRKIIEGCSRQARPHR